MSLFIQKMNNRKLSKSSKETIKLNIFLTVVCLMALASIITQFQKEYKYFRMIRDSDEITLLEEKYSGIKNLLKGKKIIGYSSDKPHDAFTLGVARYSLAPIIIIEDNNQSIIIGNFHKFSSQKKFEEIYNQAIKMKIDGDILLFEKRTDKWR